MMLLVRIEQKGESIYHWTVSVVACMCRRVLDHGAIQHWAPMLVVPWTPAPNPKLESTDNRQGVPQRHPLCVSISMHSTL